MEIPGEAVEAANKAVYRGFKGLIRPLLVKVALEAAAPIIAAHALRSAADRIMGPSEVLLDGATCRWNAMELRERAEALTNP